MKRYLTIAAAFGLILGVCLPAAAINPFVADSGSAATAAIANEVRAADSDQDVELAVAAVATTARDSFAAEAKPKPVVVVKPRIVSSGGSSSSYSGSVPDVWRGYMATVPVAGAKIGVAFTGGHRGIDFLAGMGTPIVATADGTVVRTGTMGTLGMSVKIDHGGGVATQYGHMSGYAVSAGQFVAAGTVIGYVGQTGSATTPHCHYEVWLNGARVNPAPFLGW